MYLYIVIFLGTFILTFIIQLSGFSYFYFSDRTIINEILNNIEFEKNYPNVRLLFYF